MPGRHSSVNALFFMSLVVRWLSRERNHVLYFALLTKRKFVLRYLTRSESASVNAHTIWKYDSIL